MNKYCPHCGALLEPEPGFYFGSMYITYAFNVALLVAFGVMLHYVVELSEMTYLLLIALVAAILTPPSFRISRVLWLYWFGGLRYKPESHS